MIGPVTLPISSTNWRFSEPFGVSVPEEDDEELVLLVVVSVFGSESWQFGKSPVPGTQLRE
jgi:hypothetical protein